MALFPTQDLNEYRPTTTAPVNVNDPPQNLNSAVSTFRTISEMTKREYMSKTTMNEFNIDEKYLGKVSTQYQKDHVISNIKKVNEI